MAKPELLGSGAGIAREVSAWRWVLLYIGVSLGLAALLPEHQSVGEVHSLVDTPPSAASAARGWHTSAQMSVAAGEALEFRSASPDAQAASRRLPVPANADFVRLRACLRTPMARDSFLVGFGSISDGHLDFNRAYRLWTDDGGMSGDCFEELMPRRSGDGDAILQVQLRQGPARMAMTELETQALVEDRLWRWVRSAMLIIGIALIAARFRSYLFATPRLAGMAGCAVVAGIVFGCCVSVALKADIYALATGGRTLLAPHTDAELLDMMFPAGGFSVFTVLHGVLFAAATVFLSSVSSLAWVPLMLLGAATETLQIFVPGRGPGVSDMLVDWLGVAAGLGLLVLLRGRQGKGLLLKE